ncbi:hypothetical protein HMPREF9120_00444 [Neisseria sp. oral taxon 020 str. F0370]|nr:hypothetical protein HMPREF9120_00444 [Neisseria sp. oral taxon 020 str. F0370]
MKAAKRSGNGKSVFRCPQSGGIGGRLKTFFQAARPSEKQNRI